MTRYRKYFAIAAALAVFSVAPTFGMGQAAQAQGAAEASQSASQPCGRGDQVNSAATQVSTGATGLGNAASSIAGAETKFKSMWGSKKSSTAKAATTTAKTATTTTTTPAATTPNALTTATATTQNAAGKTGGAKPCGPAKAGAGTHQEAAAGTKPAAPAATTAAATPGAGKVESMTTMPDGTYMLGYTPANATDKAYAPVKKVGPLAKPTGPNDGYYTDDKNFYTVNGGQVRVTPVGGATTASTTSTAKAN